MKALVLGATGVTIKAAGSQDSQWKVDYTYQYEAAQAARRNGVPVYVLVSAIDANAESKIFYTTMPWPDIFFKDSISFRIGVAGSERPDSDSSSNNALQEPSEGLLGMLYLRHYPNALDCAGMVRLGLRCPQYLR